MQTLAQRIVEFAIWYDEALSAHYSGMHDSYNDSNYMYLQHQVPKQALEIAAMKCYKECLPINGWYIEKLKFDVLSHGSLREAGPDKAIEILEIYGPSDDSQLRTYHDIAVRTVKPRWQDTRFSPFNPLNTSEV